jgi:hypothetical protein
VIAVVEWLAERLQPFEFVGIFDNAVQLQFLLTIFHNNNNRRWLQHSCLLQQSSIGKALDAELRGVS